MAQFIDIELGPVLRKLDNLEARLTDPTPLMEDISDVMMDAVEKNFRDEGRPEKWVDLKPATKEARRKKGTWPGKILQVSQGGLAGSISQTHSKDEASVSSNKIYAATHQFGDKDRNIPQRAFLTLAEDDIEEIDELATDYLDL